MYGKRIALLVIFTATVFLAGSPAQGQSNWTNQTGNNTWNDPSNWKPEGVPGGKGAIINRSGSDRAVLREGASPGFVHVGKGSGENGELLLLGSLGGGKRGAPSTHVGINGGKGIVRQRKNSSVHLSWNNIVIGDGSNGTSGEWHLQGGQIDINRGNLVLKKGGKLHLAGGRLRIRHGAQLHTGSTFRVDGSGVDEITVGDRSADGYWRQSAGATLAVRIDEDGVRPIQVWANSGKNKKVRFADGALLDVSFVGDERRSGVWDVMTWRDKHYFKNKGLELAPEVDQEKFHFDVVDTDDNGSKDTLQVYSVVDRSGRNWTNASGDNRWSNPENWRKKKVPARGDEVNVNLAGGVGAVLKDTGKFQATRIGWNGDGRLDIAEGADAELAAGGGEVVIGHGQGNTGTIHQTGGTVTIGAETGLVLGAEDGSGVYQLQDGVLRKPGKITIGKSGKGASKFTVSGGRLESSETVAVGVDAAGTFGLEGSDIEGIRTGRWVQGETGTLSCRFDRQNDGTPIRVSGDVVFREGAELDLSFSKLPETPFGHTWDIMRWDGELTNDGLTLAEDVSSDVWSFAFVDANNDGEKDTLRVTAKGKAIPVSSVEQLARYAKKDGRKFRMQPGTYQITDYIHLREVPQKQDLGMPVLAFSGNNSVFNLTGVTLKYDTKRGARLAVPGKNNTLVGVTLENRDKSNPRNPNGGAVMVVEGDDNTIRDVTLRVRGSWPYGYGDLLGKGANNIVRADKRSGMLINGGNSRIIGCELYMRSFGHGFFVQGDDHIYFKNCYVEGAVRATADMLQETSGPAYEHDFNTVWNTRHPEGKIMPGYVKSLSEDGFRSYGPEHLTFINCTSKNMRHGWEVRPGNAKLKNCKSIGNEVAYWIGPNSVVENSVGNAKYGPLLYLEGGNSEIDVGLLPETADRDVNVHGLATIHGSDYKIRIRRQGGQRPSAVPIMLGYSQPPAGENMMPYSTNSAKNVKLYNHTLMPVKISEKAKNCSVHTRGKVLQNKGEKIRIKQK